MTLKLTTLISAIALAASSVMAAEGTVVAKASESITINGDLRLRHEARTVDSGGTETSRNRLRHRFRLGMSFKTAYGWDIAAGLASGGNDGTSTNQTWDEYDTGDIRLDYAYAKHKFGENTVITLGQQKNPFLGAGIFWDGDVRPTGGFVQQQFGAGFVTGGYMNVDYNGQSGMGEILALQGGVKSGGLTAALSYYVANSQVAKDSYGFGAGTDYEFEMLDVYADFGFNASDVAKVNVFAQFGMNFGADDVDTQMGGGAPVGYEADENNSWYTIGAKAKIVGKVSAKVQYIHIEGDSLFGGVNDSDFGDGIDVGAGNIDIEGFKVGVGYDFTKNCSIGVTLIQAEAIERDDEELTLTQIDLQYKF